MDPAADWVLVEVIVAGAVTVAGTVKVAGDVIALVNVGADDETVVVADWLIRDRLVAIRSRVE